MTNTRTTPRTLISLLLHDVTDRPETSGFRQPTACRYKHSVRQFTDYLDEVAASGLPVVTPSGPNMPSADVAVVFTFDDGGASAPLIADLLQDHGWRGMFFVTTDLIGTPGFMNAQQIQDLHSRGHIIGSHSCTHPDVFWNLTRQQKQYEWTRSRDVLQQLLSAEIISASVPGGDCDRATKEEATAAGFQHIFTSEQLTKPWMECGGVCYGRLLMVDTTSPETLYRWLSHPTVGILPERLLRFTKSSVKHLMGPMYLRLVARRRALHEQVR